MEVSEPQAVAPFNGGVADEVEGPVEASAVSSPMGRLRARREELRAERHIDLEVPGYASELVVRYGPVAWDDLRAIADKMVKSKNPRADLYGQVDTLIAACQEILVRVDGDLQAIVEGETTRFDGMPALLDFEADNARQAVLGTFNNDLAVTTVHNRLASWMDGTDAEVDEEFLGE